MGSFKSVDETMVFYLLCFFLEGALDGMKNLKTCFKYLDLFLFADFLRIVPW